MKKIVFALTLLLGSLFVACEKKDPNPEEILEPSFSVEAEKSTVGIGEPVIFQFSSVETEQIAFFPGEEGSRYGEGSGWVLKTANSTITTHRYIYDQPGTYTATFVASNKDKHVVKELEIVVTLEPSAPDFDIVDYTIQNTTDDLGNPVYDVTFSLQGDASLISLYSGQFGNDYQYRDGRLIGYDAINMSFDVRKNANSQQDNFSVQVSTNFNGEYTFEDVSAADWTDITGHFNIPIPTPTGTWVPIEPYNIIAHKEEGKPLYVAFKYTYYPNPPAGAPSIWRVNPFKLSGVSVLGEEELGGQTNSGWTFLTDAIDYNATPRSRIEGTSQGRVGNIFFQYGNNVESQHIGHETWCVSKAFEVDGKNEPDQAILVKQATDPQLTAYRHRYTAPGVYEAVFVVKNVTENGETEIIKTMTVTID